MCLRYDYGKKIFENGLPMGCAGDGKSVNLVFVYSKNSLSKRQLNLVQKKLEILERLKAIYRFSFHYNSLISSIWNYWHNIDWRQHSFEHRSENKKKFKTDDFQNSRPPATKNVLTPFYVWHTSWTTPKRLKRMPTAHTTTVSKILSIRFSSFPGYLYPLLPDVLPSRTIHS